MSDATRGHGIRDVFQTKDTSTPPGGGTFTRKELRDDLMAAGFAEVTVLVRSETMNSVNAARKLQARACASTHACNACGNLGLDVRDGSGRKKICKIILASCDLKKGIAKIPFGFYCQLPSSEERHG
jgi:hypothetical protein